MECKIIQEVCKSAGERMWFPAFSLTDEFARRWLPDHQFAIGTRIRPSTAKPGSGFEYEATGGDGTNGSSAGREPKRWPPAAGETVTDGDIIRVAHTKSNASLIYRIASVTYDVPAGITNHPRPPIDTPSAQLVPMEVSGGTLGETYDVVAQVQATAAGDSAPLYELVLRVTVD